jgi:hypothetical protein
MESKKAIAIIDVNNNSCLLKGLKIEEHVKHVIHVLKIN